MSILLKPSFSAHLLSALLIAYAVYLIYFESDQKHYNNINIILLLSIAIALHGIGHAYLEYIYDFNPMELKFGNRKNN